MSAQVRATASPMRRPVCARNSKKRRQSAGRAVGAVFAAADVGCEGGFEVARFGEGRGGAFARNALMVAEGDDVPVPAPVDAGGLSALKLDTHRPGLLPGLVTVALLGAEIE